MPVGAGTARTIRPWAPLGVGPAAGLTFVLAERSVEDQRVADAAGHQVPDLALVGADEDALAADGGVDDLEVALDVGVGGRVEDGAAVGVEDDVGRLAGEHQLPGLAGVDAPPDAAVGAAQGGVDDHLAGRA